MFTIFFKLCTDFLANQTLTIFLYLLRYIYRFLLFVCVKTINDWFDRELDAVNEPYRPIPSGAISEGEVTFQAWFLFLSAMVLSYELDQWTGNDWPVIFATSVINEYLFVDWFFQNVAFVFRPPPPIPACTPFTRSTKTHPPHFSSFSFRLNSYYRYLVPSLRTFTRRPRSS